MLRPSATMARTAGTPSAVAGIFTYRLGSSTSSWKWRAAVIVPSVSCARPGATSRDTNPSTPAEASNTGRSTARASRMSVTTSSQYASSTVWDPSSSPNCSS